MKASLPQGVRDFLPAQVHRRQYMFDVIKSVFTRFGYEPIETPVIENLSTLTGKYGEEGDRLLFKILNNGDFLAKVDQSILTKKNSKSLLPKISKRGMRYDLTVPFARFVSMHLHELPIPFKRYQIQPVWRADRPQKGRFREFYQCDVDVVGSDALVYEAELLQIYDQVFDQLGLQVKIQVNHRQILQGLIQKLDLAQDNKLITTMDKLDKIGLEGVLLELTKQEYGQQQIDLIRAYLRSSTLSEVRELLPETSAIQGIEELEEIFGYLENYTKQNQILFTPGLARGLDYYTGFIVEINDPKAEMSSLGGGGRYANLTEVFGVKNMSGVGVSFGAERIYQLMDERALFPQNLSNTIRCIILYDIPQAQSTVFDLLSTLRTAGIPSVMYPEAAKFKKQFKYAERIQVPYAIVIGQSELDSGLYTLKDLNGGTQQSLEALSIIDTLKNEIIR